MAEAKDDPKLRGLNLELRHCDLLVPHGADHLASGDGKGYAGFRNLGNTCFINAILQVVLNVEALRSQIRNPLCPIVGNAVDVDLAIEKLRRVQEALKAMELRYASNKWCVIVPIRVLQSVFAIGTEGYAMRAGWQSDAMDCFYIFCHSVGLSPGPECWIPRPEQMLQLPQGLEEGSQMSIAQLVQMLDANEAIRLEVAPKTLVLGVLPFRMITEIDAEWVVADVIGWEDTVDMSRFCIDHAECAHYLVKAVVYHEHPLEGPANLRCGHYITYLKHGQGWYLANDDRVDPVLMSSLRGLPYIVVMERINALEEDGVGRHDEGEADEKAAVFDSVETDEVDTRPAGQISTCKGVENSNGSCSQAPAETPRKASSQNIWQGSSKKTSARCRTVSERKEIKE